MQPFGDKSVLQTFGSRLTSVTHSVLATHRMEGVTDIVPHALYVYNGFRAQGTPYPLDKCLDGSTTSTVVEIPQPMTLKDVISRKRPTILTQLQDFAGSIKVYASCVLGQALKE